MGIMDSVNSLVGSKKLTREEQNELAACVATVRAGLAAFVEAGKALTRIKTKQLFRQVAATFEEFAAKEFNLTGRRLNQIIEASGVAATIQLERPDLPQPTSESQMRSLVGLPPAAAVESYAEAVEAAGGETPSGPAVAKAARKRKPKAGKSKIARPVRLRVPGATVLIVPNKAFATVEAALRAALDQVEAAAKAA